MVARILTSTALIASLLVAPTVSYADVWHRTTTEVGWTFHPDHGESTKTRADVMRELAQAKADGSYESFLRDLPMPDTNAGPGKTREQVLQELKNVTPTERAYMEELYGAN